MKRVNFTCDEEFKEKLDKSAKEKGVSTAAYIKWAISEQIEKHEKVK